MKILIRQFLGKNHSWSVVGWGIANALLDKGHEVHLFSTDGIANLPTSLKDNVIGFTEENQNVIHGRLPDHNYDAQISYTCLKNFSSLLNSGTKNRFGIWCYEWNGENILPNGFAKGYKYCDRLIAPSNFAKDVFINSGIPKDNISVIPHGIDVDSYSKTSTIDLKTNKKYKILANIAQTHLRKNIPGLLEAYGKAFNKKDDVCLIIKAKNKKVQYPFDVSLSECLDNFKRKFPQHGEIKIYSEFIDDMSDMYRSVDSVFTMTHCEGFYMPGLEGLASGKLSIAPNWGGQKDFLDNSNSLLISGKEVRTNPHSMYWESKPNAIWFQPSIDDAAEKLQYSFKHYEAMNVKIKDNIPQIHDKYNWSTITNSILDLTNK